MHRPARATRRNSRAKPTIRVIGDFIAVGGDGTAHEILNGVFAGTAQTPAASLSGFLPLGTGNSFLRDFTNDGAEASLQALCSQDRKRTVDLIRLTHAKGEIYSFNLLSMGFTADVGALTNRVFQAASAISAICSASSCASFNCAAALSRCDCDDDAGLGRPPLPLSHVQQQQVHRRHDDDRSQRRSDATA